MTNFITIVFGDNLDLFFQATFAFLTLKKFNPNDKASDKVQMWNAVNSKKYCNIPINDQTCMWNSGIIAIDSKSKLDLLTTALKINDLFCEQQIECRVKEQFAIGIVLANTEKLKEASDFFIHYWGNKNEWNQYIKNFLSECFIKNLTIDQIIESIKIEKLKNIPISRSKRSMNKNLLNFASKFYPDRLSYRP